MRTRIDVGPVSLLSRVAGFERCRVLLDPVGHVEGIECWLGVHPLSVSRLDIMISLKQISLRIVCFTSGVFESLFPQHHFM